MFQAMIKLFICRLRNAFIYFLSRRDRKGIFLKLTYCVMTLGLLCIAAAIVICENVIYSLRESHRIRENSFLVSKLQQQVPKVSNVDCNVFMCSPQSWNDTLQSLSEMAISEEMFAFDSCPSFMARWFMIPTTVFEDEFPIAFSIIVYTDISRFVRLLRAVYRPSNVYCVHVDQKASDEIKMQVQLVVSCLENVFLPPDPINIWWGSKEVLEAEMVCLRALWRHQVKWLAFINLTGEEFPLKTNLEIVKILTLMAGRNDAWIDPCTLNGPGDWTIKVCMDMSKQGFAERWRNISAAPHNIHPFKGQIHVVLSRQAVDYVLHNPVAHDLYKWVQDAFIPDELFFSTLNGNPHIGIPGSNPNPRVKKPSIARVKMWYGRHEFLWPHCSYYLRGVCLLTAREMPLLTQSRQLFANKFKSNYRPLGYSCIEQWYYQRVVAEIKAGEPRLDLQVYHQIYTYSDNVQV